MSSGGEILYSDLLRTGFGAGAEFGLDPSLSESWEPGPFLSFAWTRYGGASKSDGFNDSVRSHGLDTIAVVVGPRIRGPLLGDLYWQGYAGVGWLREGPLQADVTINGISSGGQELTRQTDRVLGQAGIRLAWRAGGLALHAGASVQISAGPTPGKDAGLLETANVPARVQPGVFAPVLFELGVEVRF